MASSFLKELQSTGASVVCDEPLAKYTSLKVGGPADYFAKISDQETIIKLYKKAHELEIPIFTLGMGTNVLIGDRGIRGLVIKNAVSSIDIGKKYPLRIEKSQKQRRQETHWKSGFLKLSDINFDISASEGVEVNISAGTPLAYAITFLLDKGITGLEYFAGIPGTFGGAVWNNVHGADWLLEDFLKEVEVMLPDGTIQVLSKQDLGLHYDFSIFHSNEALILSATLTLPLGDKKQAQYVAEEWAKRKSFQPKNTAGCTFGNISEEQRLQAHLENCGTGYIVDRVLNAKGKRVGSAWISEKHCNFIETTPGATAADVAHIIDYIKLRTYAELGIWLHEEILRVGEF